MARTGGSPVLVLGAGSAQLPLIRAAKRLGHTVFCASISGPYPGIAEADVFLDADIASGEAVLSAAASCGAAGIVTCSMDTGIRALGYACEALGLPGPGRAGGIAASDKTAEKEAYRRCGVPTAPFFIVRTEEEVLLAAGELGYPLMIKAPDLMGSRGITKASSAEEAVRAFRTAMAETGKDHCIAERFLRGTMFGITALIQNGALVFAEAMDSVLRDGNPPFPVSHAIPCGDPSLSAEEIRRTVTDAARALGYDHCAVDMDCMAADGTVWVIESTCRCGASGIADMLSLLYGTDYYEILVRVALGEDVSGFFVPEKRSPKAVLAETLYSKKDGIVEAVLLPETLPEGVRELTVLPRTGDRVRAGRCGRDRVGQLLAEAASPEKCRALAKETLAQTEIRLRPVLPEQEESI